MLINGTCCSTRGHLASILKHKNLRVLIGRETGATYSCNANNINFRLSHSGMNAFIATKTYQTDVSGFEKDRGVLPDYSITRNLQGILENKDLDMEKVNELIRSN